MIKLLSGATFGQSSSQHAAVIKSQGAEQLRQSAVPCSVAWWAFRPSMQPTCCHRKYCSGFGVLQGYHSNHVQQTKHAAGASLNNSYSEQRQSSSQNDGMVLLCLQSFKWAAAALQNCRVASGEPVLVLCRVAQRQSRLIEGERHWAARAACQADAMQGCLWSEKVPMGQYACMISQHHSRSCSQIGAMQGHVGTGQPATNQAVRPYSSRTLLWSAAAWHGATTAP